jgi:hypothetical protein
MQEHEEEVEQHPHNERRHLRIALTATTIVGTGKRTDCVA